MIAAVLLMAQKPSLLADLIPKPTGSNGYEEFLRAADLLANDPTSKEALAGITKSPEDGDVLTSWTIAIEKAAGMLKLIRAGALKPVEFPERDVLRSIATAEGIPFRRLGRIAVTSAYVHLANGRSREATDDLLAALKIMDPLAHNGQAVGAFLTLAVHEQMFAILNRWFDAFAPADLIRIERIADEMVNRPFYADMIRRDAEYAYAAMADLEKNYKPPKNPPVDPKSKRFAALTPLERSHVIREAAQTWKAMTEAKVAVAEKSEREWLPFNESAQLDFSKGQSLSGWLLASLDMGNQPAVSLAINRTKWRLVRLTARLRRLMAEEDRIPATLPASLPTGYADDVLGGGTFTLLPTSTGFALESAGVPTTGRITLITAPPADEERPDTP